jgi:hypothetical protein
MIGKLATVSTRTQYRNIRYRVSVIEKNILRNLIKSRGKELGPKDELKSYSTIYSYAGTVIRGVPVVCYHYPP